MNLKQICTLDERLRCAADFVRDGAVVADIGTDHAYLPIYLLTSGKIKYAIASDINKGPLDRAYENAKKYGVVDRMHFVLSDGLSALEPQKHDVTDIVICGMGGELIVKIIDNSPYTRTPGVRLILQPMTFSDKLRAYLVSCGFSIIDERLCEAAGKIYTCLLAEYTGEIRHYSPAELTLGWIPKDANDPLYEKMTEQVIARLETKISGKKKGGMDTNAEEELLSDIQKHMI